MMTTSRVDVDESSLARTGDTSTVSRELTVTIHPIDESVSSHLSDLYWTWLTLFQNDPSAHITQHPDYVVDEIAACQLDQQNQSFLVTGRRGVECVAMAVLLPKVIQPTVGNGLGPSPALSGYRLAGNQLLGQESAGVSDRLLHYCATHLCRHHARFLLIEDLQTDSPLWASLHAEASRPFRLFTPVGCQNRLKIQLTDGADAYWARFSSKRRSAFRRDRKRLGNVRLQRVTEPADIPDFLENAQRVSLNSWQSNRMGLRIQNDAAQNRLLTRLAMNHALRSYLLFQDETPIAFVIGYQFNGCFDYEEVGYDRAYAEFSPGKVLLVDIINDLFSHDAPQWLDFGGGDADYKRMFATHTFASGNVWLMPKSTSSTALWVYLSACRTLNRRSRQLLAATGVMRRVRRWSRHAANEK